MTRKLVTGVVAMAAVAMLAGAALAQFAKPEDAVKYRKAAFTVMAAHFGRIGAVAQGRAPYDAASVTANAEIVADMAKLPYVAFVDGTAGTEKGTPNAKVWSERAKFDEAAKKLQDETVKLLAAAKSNNLEQVKTAFGATAAACKSCHDNFRNP